MKIRPHHLLCIQTYRGKGYSAAFVKNMNRVMEKLHSREPVRIQIIYREDEICSCCPHRTEKGCESEQKVKCLDQKIAIWLSLEEKEYEYQTLEEEIRRRMTPEILEDICRDCTWYEEICMRTFLEYRI